MAIRRGWAARRSLLESLQRGENAVTSIRSVPTVKVASLERTARLAGEAFGHEELAPGRSFDASLLQPSRWLMWLLAGLAAAAGLLVLSTR